MNMSQERARGTLLGLAAGDRIGGPVRMAIRVAESLGETRHFEQQDILKRLLAWWHDDAFDTGPTTAQVFTLVDQGLNIHQAVQLAHERAGGLTAGCNPAHRCAPLAMAAFLADTTLAHHAGEQARLTHLDPLAGEVASVVAVLCRSLIRGATWEAAIQNIETEQFSASVASALDFTNHTPLSRGGFAPDVLRAALHFAGNHPTFGEALNASIAFAGPANYCPVMVGAIAGARWGESAISDQFLTHCNVLGRLQAAAESLATDWS